MTRRMLHKAGLVAETIVAISPVAVEVRLVIPVATSLESTVLVEAEF